MNLLVILIIKKIICFWIIINLKPLYLESRLWFSSIHYTLLKVLWWYEPTFVAAAAPNIKWGYRVLTFGASVEP